MMAHGEVGWAAGRTGATGGGARLAVAPGGAKPALGAEGAKPAPTPPANPLGALATGRVVGGELERCANMMSAGIRSSKTTTMRSRRRLVDRMLTEYPSPDRR